MLQKQRLATPYLSGQLQARHCKTKPYKPFTRNSRSCLRPGKLDFGPAYGLLAMALMACFGLLLAWVLCLGQEAKASSKLSDLGPGGLETWKSGAQERKLSEGTFEWIFQRGTSQDDRLLAAQVDSSGDIVVAGRSSGSFEGYTNAGDWDFVVMKLSGAGTLQWIFQTGTTGTDYAEAAHVDSSGNIVLAGHSTGSFEGHANAGDYDMVVIKLSNSGTLQWIFQTGTSAVDNLRAVQVESSGNVVAAGHSTGSFEGYTNAGVWDVVVMKLNSSGALQWILQTGSTWTDVSDAVQVESSGDIVVAGHSSGSFEGYTTAGGYDMVVMKLNSSGDLQWLWQTGTSGTDFVRDVQVESTGSIVLAGHSTGSFEGYTNAGDYDMVVMKLNSSGALQWTFQIGTSATDNLQAVHVESSGNIVVAGQSEEGLQGQISKGDYDMVIMELNSQGTLLWLFQTGTSQADYAHAVQVDSSGDIVLAGHSLGSFEGYTTAGGFDMVVLKIGKPTTTTTTTSSAISSAKNASTSLTSTSSSSWTTLTFTPGSPEAVGAAVSAALKSLATAQAEFAELILESASDGLQREVQDAHGQLIVGAAFEVTGSDMMFENDDISVHLAAASLPRVGNLAVISTAKVHGGGMLAKLIQAYNGAAGAAQLAEPVSLHISAAGPSSTSVPMQLTMPITNGSDEFVQKVCVAWDVSTDAWTTDGVALNASDDFSVTCSIWLSFGENVSGRRLAALQPGLFSYISPSLSLHKSFPPTPGPEGQEVLWAVVLPVVAGIAVVYFVVVPVLAMQTWKFWRKRARIEPARNVEEDDFPRERMHDEPRPDSIEITQVESLRDTGSAVEAVAVSPDAEAPVDRDQMIRSFVKKEEAVDCDEGDIQAAAEAGAVSIREEDKAAKTVKKARLAMVSARFNDRNRDVEQKFRRVCQILRARGLEVLMVNAGGAQDFGDMTMEYLQQLKEKNDVMLAVCTSDYAEKTKSPYSSHAELKYALDNRLDILPLKVEATYPPEPPWGKDHPFDKKGIACGLVGLAMPSSKVFVDCIGQADVWIADEIENVLRSSSELARGLSGHGTKSELGPTTQ